MGHGSFYWYDIISKNRDASRDFLTRLFGWVASDAAMPDGTPYTSFSSGGALICGLMSLTEVNDYDEGRAHWMTYVQVDRLFSTTTRAERQGAEILSEVQPIPDLGSYQLLRDPGGALLSLVEANHPILSHGFAWNTIIWNELLSREASQTLEFYRAVTGWTAQEATTDGSLDYGFFTMGGANLAGFLHMDGSDFGDIRPGWQTYIAVEDVDAMAAKAKAAGGHIAAEPFDMPSVGRIAILIDPGETVISLLTPADMRQDA